MGTRFLLDTNTIIYMCNGTLPQNAIDFLREEVKNGVQVSIISEIEALSWEFPSIEQEHIMTIFINGSDIVNLSRPIVLKTIELRKVRKKMKLPDAVIAATALVHDFILVSRNDSDFKRIPGLRYLNPFTDL
jgi:predicted nucleic acid-binding protein